MVQMWSFATKIFCLPEANSERIVWGYREFSCQIIQGNENQTENTKHFTNIRDSNTGFIITRS